VTGSTFTLTHAPSGDEFSVATTSTLSSVVLSLISANDSGSVLVYIVPDNGSGLPQNTSITSPAVNSSAFGLTSPTLVGSVSDATIFTTGLVTVTPGTPITLTPGNYWLEATSGTDQSNGGVAGTLTSAQWNYFPMSSLSSGSQGAIGSISSFVIGANALDTPARTLDFRVAARVHGRGEYRDAGTGQPRAARRWPLCPRCWQALPFQEKVRLRDLSPDPAKLSENLTQAGSQTRSGLMCDSAPIRVGRRT